MGSADSRAIFISEIEQFGGAERSLLALSGWLYREGLPHHLVTYVDHCGLAGYATHPLKVVELLAGGRRRSGRDKVRALGGYFKQTATGGLKPLLSGYQPALHATLAGMRGFHDLMHDTPSLFGDQDRRTALHKARIRVSSGIAGYGLRSGGATIVTSEYLRTECMREFGVEAEIARMGGLSGLLGANGEASRGGLARELAGEAVKAREGGIDRGELRMLSVCRIEANKRIDWLLEALGELEQQPVPLSTRVDWRLDLAGKGALIGELTALAERLGIARRVRFLGFVPDDELEELYRGANLFLMPAVQGYGIPAVEAISRGIPVLLHRESGVSDILLETPWATVLAGGRTGTSVALATAIEGALRGAHLAVAPPRLPTEDEWAERVAGLCGWI